MRFSRLVFLVLPILFASLQRTDAQEDESVQFNRDVRPILSNNCFACHGFDNKTREAGLRLDLRQDALSELDSGDGHAIVPGNPEQSILLERILSKDSSTRMPPEDSEKSLTPAQVETIRKWIEQGAKYEQHWAFEPPKSAKQPAVSNKSWPKNLIDYFVLAKLEKRGLTPSLEAEKRTLIRRVALDVTGLPPTPGEVDQYLSDETDNAYENMVDRFLASSAYGEHMARHWLDLSRYADTSGYQYDRERQMWVWRDWVINAYNSNMPFDQFTIEQLAGDLLPNPTPHQVLATGFNRNHPITIEGGVIDEEYRTEYVIDRLVTTGTVWLGLTVGCARCHDHKYDPISQTEFYQMSAYFNQVAERGLNGFEPMAQIASPLADKTDPRIEKRLAELRNRIEQLKSVPGSDEINLWASQLAKSKISGWQILDPMEMKSSGGSKMIKQKDLSILAGGANPQKDIYEITATTSAEKVSAIRLECLTDPSLPGGGPGRHSNSNFVLSEFELVAASKTDPSKVQQIKFNRAVADYSQANYEIGKTIDGIVQGNNGWAVDGPTRKKPATAMFTAEKPFGFSGGTVLKFRLRHEAGFATHGIGRPRLSLTTDPVDTIDLQGPPADLLAAVLKRPEQRSAGEQKLLQTALMKQRQQEIGAVEGQIAQLSPVKKYPRTMIMRDLPSPRKTHFLIRGQYNLKGEEVTPGVPKALGAISEKAQPNRLGLANWLVDPGHPLTARVAVNRYWKMCFGNGLVNTMEDFGTQGELPSHPELLDSLAVEFVKQKWNVKAILRLILTSATYRQSSHVTARLLRLDPKNRLLARGPRFRLDAEQIRDQALAISGLLVHKIGGPSVYPYQPKGLWLELNNRPGYSRAYEAGKGDDLYRRSFYTFWKRTVLSPMMRTLDAPGREFCTVTRSRTNTPLQALLMLQGPQFVEAARKLAERILVEGGDSFKSRIRFGFELATARIPTDKETTILESLYQDRFGAYRSDPEKARKILQVGASTRNTELDSTELAAWTEVARLILNLDEVINRD